MSGIEGLLSGHALAERYRIEQVIGRGGFAAVYRARDEMLQRAVAVKVVTAAAPDEEARQRMRARFHREARSVARLQHPHVVTIFDFGTDARLGLDFLVMELLRGEDLAAYLSRSAPLPAAEALRILREAVEGVAAGHRAGLIHRDVKPGNLFLARHHEESDFQVKVLDFGIAQITQNEDTLTHLTRGGAPLSPGYASPEQLRGDQPLSPASDVYSLGLIGYELLGGERVFRRDAGGRARESVPPLREHSPNVPEAVAAVIDRAMAPDPAARYPDALTLARALDAALAGPTAPPDAHRVLPAEYRARSRPRLPEEPATPVRSDARTAAGRSGGGLLVGALLLVVLALGWWVVAGQSGGGGGEEIARQEEEEPSPVVEEPASREPEPEPEPVHPSAAGGVDESVDSPGPGSGGGETAARMARNAAALHREGLEMLRAGEIQRATERLRDAVRLVPENAVYRNNLAWSLYLAGKMEESTRELEETLNLEPERAIAWANLGTVLLARSDTTGAVAAFERFLELNTDPARERVARATLEQIGERE